MTSRFTVIYYYVPEDHDDPSIPNAFGVPISQKEITYKDIEENFPLEGKYIFRFKFKHGKKIVWLDLQKKSDKVPQFDKMIFLKVTRVNWGNLTLQQNVIQPQQTNQQISLNVPNENILDAVSNKNNVDDENEDLFADFQQMDAPDIKSTHSDITGDMNLLGI